MWSAGAGFSSDPDPRRAAAEASGAALENAGGADVALVFAGPGHGAGIAPLLDAARSTLGTDRLVGALTHGVLGAGLEQEGGAGVSVLALRGLEAELLWLPELAGREERLADELRGRLGDAPGAGDLVVLLPDPSALRPGPLLDAICKGGGESLVVGAGAGAPVGEGPLLWSGSERGSGGLCGLVLRGARARRIGVTQACRPVTPLLTVTSARGPWIDSLDGRPALDVYREAAGEPLADDLRRAAATVLAALPGEGVEALGPGDYRVRNIAGFSPESGSFAIPETLARGAQLALVQREPETARADLLAMLEGLDAGSAGLALYFDCCARGAGFFGVPGLESAYLARALGDTPLAGMFGSCELGPIAGRAELLNYTGVLALLDR